MNMLKALKQAWLGNQNNRDVTESTNTVSTTQTPAPEASIAAAATPNNVIALPVVDREVPSQAPASDIALPQEPAPLRFKGLFNAPELESFFAENFFGYGRHTGSKFRTQEMLAQGKQSITSQFQNKLTELIERKQEKINKLRNEMIAIEGVSNAMSAQLRLACDQLQRDINLLGEQIEAAVHGRGWVLEPLQRYEIGFTKGLREAIEFELLAN